MKNDNAGRSPLRQLAKVVAQYDREGGGRELRHKTLDDWPDSATRGELHFALLQCDLAHSISGVNRSAVFAETAAELGDRQRLIELCRSLYDDTASLNQLCHWSDYAELGLNADELQLCLEGDPLRLGVALHDRYSIVARVGHGAFGVVYKAIDLVSNNLVAIKAPRGAGGQHRLRAAQLLQRESDVLRALGGAGTPALVDVVTVHADLPIVLMEFVEGPRLTQWLREAQATPEQSAKLVSELAETVHHLHRAGFVHRDIKPDNIVMRPDGRPCLIDMGVAFAEADRFTTEGKVIGTLNYMAPEGLLGMATQLDGRCDVWSLGAIFYEMLTGKLLQRIDSREAALVAAVAIHIDRPELPEEIPETLQQICLRCLAREPNERFSSAGELAAALRSGETAPEAVDVDSLRQRLLGWRLGMKYGAVLENLAYLGRYLHQMGELANSTGTVEGDAGEHFGMARGFAMSLVIAHDDLRKLALGASIVVPALEIARSLQESFYRKDQSVETAEWLRERLPELRTHLEIIYRVSIQGLQAVSDAASACCELAARCTMLLFSQDDYGELDRVWQRTGIKGDAWQQLKETFERGPAAKEALIRLDKEIERQLVFGEPATFGKEDLLGLLFQ